jgi:3-hydroxyisobutyrate dehydrogenase-like beta-hydroxyacid dehydrogenase
MPPVIGFIGLGNLGTPIAANILDSGHGLHVFNRTRSKTAELQKKGAVVCNSIRELAEKCTVVFSIVSDDAALNAICSGNGGLLENLRPGSLHISMSTILPETAREIASQHQRQKQVYLSAPVFGRPEAAAARKLNFAISGPEDARIQAEPLLKDAGAAAIWLFGEDPSSANLVKICGNFLIASALEAIGESVQLATKAGLDPASMWGMFNQTLFNTPVYNNYSKIILQKQFEPAAFTAKLGLKDINLVLSQASSLDQEMPLAELLRDNLGELIENGHGESDWSALSFGPQFSGDDGHFY